MSKEYTITNIKETIKNMLLEDAEITKILLCGKDNTYKNVNKLFNENIFDYQRNREMEYMVGCEPYIEFDVDKNAFKHKYCVVMNVKMHKDIIHKHNDSTNYLDLLTEKIIADIEINFGEDIKERKYKDNLSERISNQAGMRNDSFAERHIVFFL